MSHDDFSQINPIEDWSRKVHEIMDEMQRRQFVDFRDHGAWRPAVNVYETDAAYYVCVELAGVRESEIDVDCLGPRHVKISGNRVKPQPVEEDVLPSVHALEIDEGPYCREIGLPEPIDVEHVHATYNEGYLWIILPRLKAS